MSVGSSKRNYSILSARLEERGMMLVHKGIVVG